MSAIQIESQSRQHQPLSLLVILSSILSSPIPPFFSSSNRRCRSVGNRGQTHDDDVSCLILFSASSLRLCAVCVVRDVRVLCRFMCFPTCYVWNNVYINIINNAYQFPRPSPTRSSEVAGIAIASIDLTCWPSPFSQPSFPCIRFSESVDADDPQSLYTHRSPCVAA